jgi:HPt (histidine-containing phosphotransfer) domain-containing protein
VTESAPPDADADFDRTQFEEASGGDEAFAKELIAEFMVSAPELLRQAHDAVAAGDVQRLDHATHALAGGCSMLGARKLASSCREAQRLAEAGDLPAAHSTLEQADRDLAALEQTFEEISMKRAA